MPIEWEGARRCPSGCPQEGGRMLKDMLVRISMGRGIAYGDALRDAHRMLIGMSMRRGVDAYCGACTDAYRKGELLGIL